MVTDEELEEVDDEVLDPEPEESEPEPEPKLPHELEASELPPPQAPHCGRARTVAASAGTRAVDLTISKEEHS